MEFEWDAGKAAGNEKKHGVPFTMAVNVFLDANRMEWSEEAPSESRWATLGLANGTEIFVVYTLRRDVIRLISARKANKHERETYWNR